MDDEQPISISATKIPKKPIVVGRTVEVIATFIGLTLGFALLAHVFGFFPAW